MKRAIFFVILILTFVQCGKRKQYSTWKINGQEYTSNNVEIESNYYGNVSLECRDKVRFALIFADNYLPSSGQLVLTKSPSVMPGYVGMGICIDTVCYHISDFENKFLTASENNRKSGYSLPPSWFVSFSNPLDSILVEGTFNEP